MRDITSGGVSLEVVFGAISDTQSYDEVPLRACIALLESVA